MVLPLWKSVWQLLNNLKIDLLQDPTIPLSGIYTKGSISYYRNSFSSVFFAALVIIVKNWKQSRCLSTGEWTMKMWYNYIMEYNQLLRKRILGNLQMDKARKQIIACEITQTSKDTFSLTCGC